MGRGLDWAMLEPAQHPTVGELRILTALRSIGYGELKVIVQAHSIVHVDMLHQTRPTDEERALGPIRVSAMASS